MSFDIETIYSLLPAVYRTRDAAIAESMDDLLTPGEQLQLQTLRDHLASGAGLGQTEQRDLARLEEKRVRGPLKALLMIIAEQAAGLEENIDQLYDDQFIETCAEWVVPYIADIIGYRALGPGLQQRLGSTRAEVANTIRFRRRKGTAAVLEEMALDITEWDAAVVEFFLRLSVTQYLNHIRVDSAPRENAATSRADRPIDQPGSVNVRYAHRLERIGTPFDPASHTADVRRIASSRGRYNIPNVGIFLWRVGSRQITDSPAFRVDARRFMFNRLGSNTHLYGRAERESDITKLASPLNVPLPITRRTLRQNLAQLYGSGRSLMIQRGNHILSVAEVEACDLSDTGGNSWAHASQIKVAIDPQLGRIAFPDDVTEQVIVSYYYGALSDIGGGEYSRQQRLGVPPPRVVRVPKDWPDLGEALNDLKGIGTVEIVASGLYTGLTELVVPANSLLELRAADENWPMLRLAVDLLISGGDSAEVILQGLLIAGGRIMVPAEVNGLPNRLQKLRLVDCTLLPGGELTRDGQPGPAATSLEIEAPNVTVEIERCILGGLRVSEESRASVSNSIVDGLDADRVAYAALDGEARGGSLAVDSCTIIGKVNTALLTASNSIFHARLSAGDTWTAPVRAERRQAGYLRYSYVPLNAYLPPRYACTPKSSAEALQIVPRFTSLRYGDPAYCQLHSACPHQISMGAADQGEMGVFHDRYASQRAAGLRSRLDEYLRFGLEAGLFYAS
jgi:hypothetical protein